MGWKLAVALTKQNGRTLEECVSAIYGEPKLLEPSDLVVDEVIYPEDDSVAYALSYNDLAWVFDWPLIISSFDDGPESTDSVHYYLFHSTTNLYGFSEYNGSSLIRARAGSADDGIYIDFGPPYERERKAVKAAAKAGFEQQAWDAWMDPSKSFPGPIEDVTHDLIAEEVIFALMEQVAAFRLDRSSKLNEQFIDHPVLKVI